MTQATTEPLPRRPARERLLAAAGELFYAEGFAAVGIDRVIERAGVAKASLYDAFGSKEELIRAYLLAKQSARQARIEAAVAEHERPVERVLAIFDSLGRSIADPAFRGCAFIKASAEAGAGDAIGAICEGSRAWLRERFRTLAADAGVRDPATVARQLQMLYDGASVAAQIDHDREAAVTARAMAAALLETPKTSGKHPAARPKAAASRAG